MMHAMLTFALLGTTIFFAWEGHKTEKYLTNLVIEYRGGMLECKAELKTLSGSEP
jgi:hypothetical protein